MKAVRRALRFAVPLAVGILVFAGSAPAQDEPLVIGAIQEVPKFQLTQPKASVTLEALFAQGEDTQNGATSEFSQQRFDELLNVSTTGHIIHPNLIELELDNSFGLSQGAFESDGVTSDENGTLYEFDNQVTFLRDQPVPLTVYARRTQSLINRTFGETLENTQTTYGASTSFTAGSMSNRVEAFHTEVEQSGIVGPVDFKLDEDVFLWNGIARPADNQTVYWDYTFTDIEQMRPGFDSQFQTHDGRASHVLDFGPERRSSLTSSLDFFDQSGDFSISSLRWDESLRLRHDEDLTSQYRYTFQERQTSGSEQTRHRATAGVRHRLFDSLTSAANVGIQDLSFDNEAGTREFFGDLDFDYRKIVPYGRITAALGGGLFRQDNDARGQPLQVIDDLETFTDSIPVVILGRNIESPSIVVTDSANVQVFTPGLDYTVRNLGDRIEIERILGGFINAGDSVLVDYVLGPEPANAITTTTLSAALRYDLEEGLLRGFAPYVRYLQQDQSIDSPSPSSFVANTFTDIVTGLEYRLGGLTLTGERQRHDGEVFPFEASRLLARYARRLGYQTTVSLDSAYTITDFLDEDNRVRLLTGGGRLSQRFTPQLTGNLSMLFRKEEDELRGDTQAFEQQVELTWEYRQTRIYLLARNVMLDSPLQDNTFQLLQFGFKREF